MPEPDAAAGARTVARRCRRVPFRRPCRRSAPSPRRLRRLDLELGFTSAASAPAASRPAAADTGTGLGGGRPAVRPAERPRRGVGAGGGATCDVRALAPARRRCRASRRRRRRRARRRPRPAASRSRSPVCRAKSADEQQDEQHVQQRRQHAPAAPIVARDRKSASRASGARRDREVELSRAVRPARSSHAMSAASRRRRGVTCQVIRLNGPKGFVPDAQLTKRRGRRAEWPRPRLCDPLLERPRYFAAGGRRAMPPGVSFGGTPMTFTPAPRATSIASMMSAYFTSDRPSRR